jgi:Tfp pilus assembly protein PilZ
MDYLLNSNDNPDLTPGQERRKHPRKTCAIEGNFRAQGLWHKASVQNISPGGAYIRTLQGRALCPGEEIFLVTRIRVLREQLRGKIAWVGPHGIGVEFHTVERV